MTQAVVCDASALVALLLDAGPDGEWVAEMLVDASLAAPALVDWETANVIRRHERSGLISHDQAAQAHVDLLDLEIERWPYELVAARAWELRANLTTYDASYVAVAELLRAPLVTLDGAIGASPDVAAAVLTPGMPRPSSGS